MFNLRSLEKFTAMKGDIVTVCKYIFMKLADFS